MKNNITVITGSQRSGTSFFAEFMNKCGYETGGTWDDHAFGGYESPEVSNFFRTKLKQDDFPFNDLWKTFKRKKTESIKTIGERNKVIKFSFLTMNVNLLKMWTDDRGFDDNFLILMRNSEDVIKSKQLREQAFDDDNGMFKISARQLIFNRIDSINYMVKNKMKFKIILSPYFMSTPRPIIEILTNFCNLDMPKKSIEIWGGLYKPSKLHFKR